MQTGLEEVFCESSVHMTITQLSSLTNDLEHANWASPVVVVQTIVATCRSNNGNPTSCIVAASAPPVDLQRTLQYQVQPKIW